MPRQPGQKSRKEQLHDAPDHCERESRIYVYEQTGHLVCVVKNQTIPPRNNCACDNSVAESVARDEERRRLWEHPEEYKVENIDIVA